MTATVTVPLYQGGAEYAAVRQPVVGAKKIVNLLGGFARVAPGAGAPARVRVRCACTLQWSAA